MKTLLLVVGLFVGGFVLVSIFVFNPVPIPAEKDCLIARGVVQRIDAGPSTKDVVFTLAGSPTTFYVNRGLERGLKVDVLKKQLLGQEILIKYPSYWTPLGNSSKHISKIEWQGNVVFTELKD